MYDKNELCQKIKSIYPDIGECGIDVNVDYDDEKNAWVVGLQKDKQEVKTYLKPEDADVCLSGKQCIGLRIQIAQLRCISLGIQIAKLRSNIGSDTEEDRLNL